jgi:hypothetical protein
VRREVASILWRRLDRPGHEAAWLFSTDSQWRLAGTSVFGHDGSPCRLDYSIVCDRQWRTREAVVSGWLGSTPIEKRIRVEDAWLVDGVPCPAVTGCIDVDLNFSPVTNLLPIRRLNLAVGQSAPVRAAWLRFPSFKLELLEQVYQHIGEHTYRYESAGGSFVATLEVDDAAFVTEYPGFFTAERAR